MKSWLPTELTNMAHSIDTLFYIMLAVVTVFFVLVEFLLVYFLIRYRRTRTNQVGVNVHGNNKLETVWTLIPAVILVVLGVYSVKYVYAIQTPQASSSQDVIHVTGHEWSWQFTYPNGVSTTDDLRVPAGQHVLFDITSADVIHGFYIPSVRLQQDAMPGRLTQFSIDPKTSDIGKTFRIPCDQYCGVGHPNMVAHLTVMSPSGYQKWLDQQKQSSSS